MKYYKKTYLYNFLADRGYSVPKKIWMEYEFYRGNEWLRGDLLEAYSPKRGVIYVTVKENREEREVEVEYSKYENGVLVYQVLDGKRVILKTVKHMDIFCSE